MNFRAPRYISLVSAIGLVSISLAGCDNKKESVSDVLAQDSTLNLQVMAATGDTPITALGDSNLSASTTGTSLNGTNGTIAGQRRVEVAAVEPNASTPTAPTPIISAQPSPRVSAPVRAASTRSVRTRQAASKRSTSRRTATTTRVRSVAARRQAANAAPKSSSISTGTYSPNSGVARSSASVESPSTTTRTAGTISAGSELALVAGQRVCSYASHVGDGFTTLLTESVQGTNGVSIPRGAMATAEITSIDKKKSGARRIGVRIQSISFRGKTYPVRSDVSFAEVEQVGKTTRKKTSKTAVATGAGVGAILGGVVGGGVGSTVIGAAGGAVAGAAIGSRTVATDGCIPERGQITAHLSEPLNIAVLD